MNEFSLFFREKAVLVYLLLFGRGAEYRRMRETYGARWNNREAARHELSMRKYKQKIEEMTARETEYRGTTDDELRRIADGN